MERRERRGFFSWVAGAITAIFAPASVARAASPEPPVPVAPEEPVAFQQVIQRFESFEEMVNSIRAHVARTGDYVLSNDDPKLRLIGFSTDGGDFQWNVPLMAIKDFQTANSQIPRELVARVTLDFQTMAGRTRFAEWLSSGKLPNPHPYR